MATKTCSVLQAIIEDAGYETRSYSGRSMYGKTCLGVEFDGGVGEFFAAILEALGEDEDEPGEESVLVSIADAFRGMCTDSMGRGTVFYFPDVAHFGGEESEDFDVERFAADTVTPPAGSAS